MKVMVRSSVVFLAALVFPCAKTHGQAINIDLGTTTHAVPSSTYGGAANQPGVWNLITDASVPRFSGPLVDVLGQPTAVTIAPQSFTGLPPDFGLQVANFPVPGLTGDEAALHNDRAWQTDSAPNLFIEFRIAGLVDGAYDLYVYAGDDNNCACVTSVQSGTPQQQICFSPGAGFAEGSVWAHLCCATNAGSITFHVTGCMIPLTYVYCSGLQLVPRAFSCSDVTEAFCSGTAFGASCACPCGNCGLPGRGCENSFATGGGRLAISGTPSVSADTLVLQANFLPPTTSGLFYQGTGTIGGGFGAVYGDGLRCVGGSAIRLGTRFASGGVVAFGAGQGSDPLVSVAGLIPAGGGTRYYQVWYRNAPSYCTPSTVNLTNGYKVRWFP